MSAEHPKFTPMAQKRQSEICALLSCDGKGVVTFSHSVTDDKGKKRTVKLPLCERHSEWFPSQGTEALHD